MHHLPPSFLPFMYISFFFFYVFNKQEPSIHLSNQSTYISKREKKKNSYPTSTSTSETPHSELRAPSREKKAYDKVDMTSHMRETSFLNKNMCDVWGAKAFSIKLTWMMVLRISMGRCSTWTCNLYKHVDTLLSFESSCQ